MSSLGHKSLPIDRDGSNQQLNTGSLFGIKVGIGFSEKHDDGHALLKNDILVLMFKTTLNKLADMDLVVGIDIGGTKTKIGLVDEKGECQEKLFFRTQEFENFDDFLDKIKDSIEELKGKFNSPVNLIGCGIGAPNASSRNGTIENADNLKRH